MLGTLLPGDLDCQTSSDLTSSQPLCPLVDLGAFSPDLFHRLNVVAIDCAPISHRERLAYSVVQRTDPRVISRFTNPRAPVQNGTAPIPAQP
jgi:transcriptional regulator of aromatic amino acid metabolism